VRPLNGSGDVTVHDKPHTLSGAQANLLRAALYSGGTLIVSECECRSAEALVLLGLAVWTGEREIALIKSA
jgi:hypothetical protein